ncbi:MAG: hypothetical protein RL346_440 [Verrucomicrobiota bacterium]|jgi:hypothetical protein
MGFLSKILTGAGQLHKQATTASKISATLRPYFDPVYCTNQMSPADFKSDPYVVGFTLGACQGLAILFGTTQSDVNHVARTAVAILLGEVYLINFEHSQVFDEGVKNGAKVVLCIHAPHKIDLNSSDKDLIKAKSKIIENSSPIKLPPNTDPEFFELVSGNTIGAKMYDLLFWDYFSQNYFK